MFLAGLRNPQYAHSTQVLKMSEEKGDNVRVIVRCRPFNKREKELGDYDII